MYVAASPSIPKSVAQKSFLKCGVKRTRVEELDKDHAHTKQENAELVRQRERMGHVRILLSLHWSPVQG